MYLRRAIYLSALVAAFFYYMFHTRYLSWILLIAVIALPLVSLLLSFFFLSGARIWLTYNTPRTTVGSGFLLTVKMVSAQLSRAFVQVRFENLFSGETQKKHAGMEHGDELAMMYQSGQCGVVRCYVTKARLLDLLGIIGLPLRLPKPLEILVLPEEKQYDEAGDPFRIEHPEQLGDMKTREFAEREWRDVREYHAGDMLRDVHWKLSARSEGLIIREYEMKHSPVVRLGVLWAGNRQELSGLLSELLGIAAYIEAQDFVYELRVIEQAQTQEDQLHMQVARNEAQLERIVWDLLKKQPGDCADLLRVMRSEDVGELEPVLLMTPEMRTRYLQNSKNGEADI